MNILNKFKKNHNTLTEENTTITKEILEWFYCIIIAIIIALFFRYFIATPTTVKMTSMFPTLKESDRLILNRTIRISNQNPNRGDIITFEAPSKQVYTDDEIEQSDKIAKYENLSTNIWDKFIYHVLELNKTSYIKRVIALPGEHVEIKDGNVYINGEKLQEEYLHDNVITNVIYPGFDDFIVPDNCIFAMGDNRTGSKDCRNFGCIPIDKIESIVLFRFWPLDKFGKVV